MLNPFSRTELLPGRDAMERLAASRVADIYKTRVDPPARVMRRELKKRTSGNERPSIPRSSLFAPLILVFNKTVRNRFIRLLFQQPAA